MEALAGIAIGGLFGLLLGLSTSPLLQGVLSALITLLGGFLVINKKGVAIEAAKVAGFAVGCAAFVVLGIYVRTSGLVSGSDIVDRYRQLKAINFSDEEARRLAVTPGTDPASQLRAKSKTGGLFSEKAEKDCGDLNPGNIPDVQDELKTFANAAGDWKTFADLIGSSNLSGSQKTDLLKLFWSAKCEAPSKQ